MGDAQSESLIKKKSIKIFLVILVIAVVYALGYAFIQEDKPYAGIFIALAVVIPLMVVSGMWGYKNKDLINSGKSKLWYFLLVVGLFQVFLNSWVILGGDNGFNYFVQVGVGLLFVGLSIYKIKKGG